MTVTDEMLTAYVDGEPSGRRCGTAPPDRHRIQRLRLEVDVVDQDRDHWVRRSGGIGGHHQQRRPVVRRGVACHPPEVELLVGQQGLELRQPRAQRLEILIMGSVRPDQRRHTTIISD